ncbi:AMP-binding enzyme [Rhodococcus qingshengii]|uniref:AMP-binding enzyme C-terminal domain-containing protein n=1 Tax=Rhodococcus qingshengii TaxID=334542 RepID=A0A2A5J8K6_RHOSG|nr:hypothetical protein [Rhodococcus qingshengii]PCK25843.1 hypothetical protein CHR55_19050 [Rhodococcus qingshengii]
MVPVASPAGTRPAEVEKVLRAHDDVRDACVFGIPSERWGESPHAVVFHEELPYSPTGKQLWRRLRDRHPENWRCERMRTCGRLASGFRIHDPGESSRPGEDTACVRNSISHSSVVSVWRRGVSSGSGEQSWT